ncbi:hypothetical protein SO802_006898 [Lithocarpus litseifolius]|uniref:F-box domain-containing protein n=1 Tax=Lithocarpus litseifolius TaxID=425828 RepID=A0AAW2DM64_9ROSI
MAQKRGRKKKEYRNWLDLPKDVTVSILQRLGAINILESAQKVCMLWRNICKDPSMWRAIDMQNLDDLHNMPYNLKIMCIHAIDCSCEISTSSTLALTNSSSTSPKGCRIKYALQQAFPVSPSSSSVVPKPWKSGC